METAHELLMGLSDGEFDNLRKVRDTEGYEAAVELLTPKFSGKACEIVNELDRIDNFAKPKKNKEVTSEEEQAEETNEVNESGIEEQVLEQPKLINIAEEGQEAQFVPNPQLLPIVGATPVINTNILQDPSLKANDIQDGMQAGQATGAQIAMNRINDMKIQQFSKPILSYTDALDLIRETELKDLKKEIFDEILSAYQSRSNDSTGSNELNPVFIKYELPIDKIDNVIDIISKVKEESDNFTSKGRKVVLVTNKENFSMSIGKRVILINFDVDSALSGAGTGALIGGAVGTFSPEIYKGVNNVVQKGQLAWNKNQATKYGKQEAFKYLKDNRLVKGGAANNAIKEQARKLGQEKGTEMFKKLNVQTFGEKTANKLMKPVTKEFTPKAAKGIFGTAVKTAGKGVLRTPLIAGGLLAGATIGGGLGLLKSNKDK